jgi:hypothetical protein
MDARTKMGVGSVLAILGGLGIVITLGLGFTSPEHSWWDFIVGLFIGIAGGIGVALALAGMVEMRRGGR